MAQLGVDAVAKIGEGEQPPSLPEGKDYLDTGTNLVTAKPLGGIKSQTVDRGPQALLGHGGRMRTAGPTMSTRGLDDQRSTP